MGGDASFCVFATLHQVTFRVGPGDRQSPKAYLARQSHFWKMPRFIIRETAMHWIDVFRSFPGPPLSVLVDRYVCDVFNKLAETGRKVSLSNRGVKTEAAVLF